MITGMGYETGLAHRLPSLSPSYPEILVLSQGFTTREMTCDLIVWSSWLLVNEKAFADKEV